MPSFNANKLKDFLYQANLAGYASGAENNWIKEKDGSTSIRFSLGNWQMHDNYFGGEPYGGRLVVFYQGKPVWLMVYYGWVEAEVKPDSVYPFLRQALKQMPTDFPLRGPKELKTPDFYYLNKWQGNILRYSGEEKIFSRQKLVYQASYMGGLIDQIR